MSIENVLASTEAKGRIRRVLEEDAPLAYDEIIQYSGVSDAETQRALNELWREGIIYLTVDRRFDLTGNRNE